MMDSEAQDNPAAPQEQPPEYDREDRAHIRERMLHRFEVWLDEILDGEQPPEGIAAEILEQLQADTPAEGAGKDGDGCDLYTLWSAVTTMAEETRLQGRAFKQLHESLSPMQELVGSVGATLQRYETALDRQEQGIDEASRQAAWNDILATLIDLRDRLIRGVQSAWAWLQRPQPVQESGFVAGIRARFHGRPDDGRTQQQEEAVQSLLKGYTLSQEVLDEALVRIGVRPIDCLGQPFDPLTMKAIDIEPESDASDGTVLEVYRQGYWRGETVYRPAEVKVARQPQQSQQNEQNPPADQGEQHES